LIYAYHLTADGIAGYVWGKLNYKTAKKLRGKLKAHLQNPVFRHKALIAGKEKKEYQELP
jgi:IS1 family transposase